MRTAFVLLMVSAATNALFGGAGQSTENGTTFEVPGARIYFHATGSGATAPLVIVNGGPGFDHNYLHCSNVWGDFAKNRRVVFYDQRGNGRSPAQQDAAMDLGAQIDDLEALRAHLGADRMDLLGHSWGGYLSMAYAARHPEHVRRLAIVDSAAPKWSDSIVLFDEVYPDTVSRQKKTSFANALGDRAAGAENIRLYLTMLFYSPEKRDQFMSHVSEYHFAASVNRAVTSDLGRYDVTPELEKFRLPTLVITGRYDMNVAPLTAVKIHEAIPDSMFVVFERSGHLPFFEEPDAFLKVVEEFLEK